MKNRAPLPIYSARRAQSALLRLLAASVIGVVSSSCATTPQLMRDHYEQVEDERPVASEKLSSLLHFSDPGSTANAGQVEVSVPAGVVLLTAGANGPVLASRPGLCLHATEQTVRTYQDYDHVGGWKTQVPVFAGIAAATLGGYSAYAAAKSGDALPAYALEHSPYADPGATTKEAWQNRAIGTGVTGGALAVAAGLILASNWWTTPEPGLKLQRFAGTLVEQCAPGDLHVLFRPTALTLGSMQWERTVEVSDELPLGAPSQQGNISRWTQNLLDQERAGQLAFQVTADVIAFDGAQRIPLQLRWHGEAKQAMAGGDPVIASLVRIASKNLQPTPMSDSGLALTWDDALKSLTVKVPCGAVIELKPEDQGHVLELAGGLLIRSEGRPTIEAVAPAKLTQIAFAPSVLNHLGPPTGTALAGTAPNMVCSASWPLHGGASLAGWLDATLHEATVMRHRDQRLGAAAWPVAAQRTALLVTLLSAGAGAVEARTVALTSGAGSPGPSGLPVLSAVSKAVTDLELSAAYKALVGEQLPEAAALLCGKGTPASPACAAWKTATDHGMGALRTLTKRVAETLVQSAIHDAGCPKDLALDEDDKADEQLERRCLNAGFAGATRTVAKDGKFPDAALTAKMAQFRATQLNTVRNAIAKAKREAAAERAKQAREEAEERRASRHEERTDRGSSGGSERCTPADEAAASGTGMSCEAFKRAVQCMRSKGFYRGCEDEPDMERCMRAAQECGAH